MGMTITEVVAALDQEGIKYEVQGEKVVASFRAVNFVDPENNKQSVFVAVVLQENGEVISFFAPRVFHATGRHADAFLKACTIVQGKMKLLRFDLEDDGWVDAQIDLPLEDGTATPKQIKRCITAIPDILDRVYPTLQAALQKGKINFPS